MTGNRPSPKDRPPIRSYDTLDANQLTGSLTHDGLAALRPAHSPENTNGAPRSARPVGQGVHNAGLGSPEPSATANSSDDSDEAIENYDDLQIDPDTLIVNARKSMDDTYRPNGEMAGGGKEDEQPSGSSHRKRNSIQIRLERTDKKGRYILTADDPEIKDILRKGIEKEEAETSGKKPRIRFRDLVFTRQFTTFDRQNPASAESPFFGFFTLFWICMLLIFFQVAMRNWRDYGSILGRNQVMKMMFSRDVVVLGLTDGVMCAATFEGLLFQKLIRHGWISWAKSGWIIQNVWQTAYLGAVIWWAYFREWPWTHTIFAVLHGLVFLMKQHSYAFYNGYLSGVYRRRALLERKLKQLEDIDPIQSAPNSPASPRGSFSTALASGTDLNEITKRRPSMAARTSTNFTKENSRVADVAAAIESGSSIDVDQMTTFASIIRNEIDDLSKELQGKASTGLKAYPNNLTISNFADYICLPTLVYELEYPRQERINWWYVLEKTAATFGVLCVMQVVSQGFIYPQVAKTMQMKERGMTLEQRWEEFPFIVSDLLFPMLIEQLLTWYLIWECILNVLAEVTKFADRGFYGDWWNSVTWDQYARDWNRPVHNFLLRHVYHSTISTFHLSKTAATFVTFLLSALVHEMCMALMFKKVRGYLFWLQLLQMPLVAFSRSKLMKGRVVLGNTIFWIGLFIGPSLLTSLYLVV